MNDKRLLSLIFKYQDNVCTEGDLQELEQWYTLPDTGNPTIESNKAAIQLQRSVTGFS